MATTLGKRACPAIATRRPVVPPGTAAPVASLADSPHAAPRYVPQYDPPSQKVLDELKAYVARHLLAAESNIEWRHDLDPQFDVEFARPSIATYDIAYEFENDRHGGNADPGLAVLLTELQQRGIVKPLSAEQQAELVASDQRRNPRGTWRPDAIKTAWEVLSLDAAIQYWPDAFK